MTPEAQVVMKIKLMAKLQESEECKKASFAAPVKLARRVSKNQVVGSHAEWDESMVLRERTKGVNDSGLTNFSGLIQRKTKTKRRRRRRPRRMKTPLTRPAGRKKATNMTARTR